MSGKLIFKAEELIPVIQEARKNKCSLLLVYNHGVCLRSAQAEKLSDNELKHIVYAQGCNPHTDEDFYENMHDIFDGEDGVIDFDSHETAFDVVLDKQANFIIKVTSSSFTLITEEIR